MNEFHTPVGIILPSEALGQHRKLHSADPGNIEIHRTHPIHLKHLPAVWSLSAL